MINKLNITISDKREDLSEEIILNLNEDIFTTEEFKIQMTNNIISSFPTASIDIKLVIQCNYHKVFDLKNIKEKIKVLNKGKLHESPVENLLSKREREVLSLILLGFTNCEIAHKLFISSETVKSHRKHILHKTNSRNTACLVKLFSQQLLKYEIHPLG